MNKSGVPLYYESVYRLHLLYTEKQNTIDKSTDKSNDDADKYCDLGLVSDLFAHGAFT